MGGEFPAMGTTVVAHVDDAEAFDATRRLFEAVEQACSRFRPDSELSAINRRPSEDTNVSPMMHEVLTVADQARDLTNGLVDVGVGGAVHDWGYDRTIREVRDLPSFPPTPEAPSWSLSEGRLHRPAGVRLDLGGIAKGWTCDRAVDSGLARLVGAGGDIRSSNPEASVEILDPWGSPVATVALGRGALATSSVSRRRWKVAGRDAHHLIDPRTLRPSTSPILSASAITRYAWEAEAAAKAILLKGEHGLRWAEDRPWIRGAIAVWWDGSVFATPGLKAAA